MIVDSRLKDRNKDYTDGTDKRASLIRDIRG